MEGLIPFLMAGAAALLGFGVWSFAAAAASPAERVVWEASEVPFLLRASLRAALPLGRRIREAAGRLAEAGREGASPPLLLSLLARLQKGLVEAGEPGGIQPPEFLGVCLLAPVAGILLGLGCFAAVGAYPAIWIGLFLLLIGLLPPMWLSERIRGRKRGIRHSLPFALDLLTLSVEAGMDFAQAIGRLGDRLKGGALAAEFGRMLREIQMGKSRAEALRGASDRMGVDEFGSVAVALIQADELGGSLGPVLRIQADQVRERRFQRAEETAMKAPVKLLFPLILIFLCTIIVIWGSIYLEIVHLGIL